MSCGFANAEPFIHPLGTPAPAAAQRQGKTTPLIEAIAMTQTALRWRPRWCAFS